MIPLGLCVVPVESYRDVENQAAIERFARFLVVKGYAADTQRLYMGGVTRWLAAGGSPGHVDAALLAEWLRSRRLRTSVATVNLVLGRLPLETFIGLRDYAMLLTLYATGLRAGELIRMQTSHLVGDGMLFVQGKARRDRYVPLGTSLQGVLQGYLHARAGLRPGKVHAFWLAHTGRPLRNGRTSACGGAVASPGDPSERDRIGVIELARRR